MLANAPHLCFIGRVVRTLWRSRDFDGLWPLQRVTRAKLGESDWFSSQWPLLDVFGTPYHSPKLYNSHSDRNRALFARILSVIEWSLGRVRPNSTSYQCSAEGNCPDLKHDTSEKGWVCLFNRYLSFWTHHSRRRISFALYWAFRESTLADSWLRILAR